MQIRMENLTSGAKYTFPCGQWLCKDQAADGQVVRELAAQSACVTPLQRE